MDWDRIFRRLNWVGLGLWIIGGVLLVIGWSVGALWSSITVVALLCVLAALMIRLIDGLDRLWMITGRTPKKSGLHEPPAYLCPNCGYQLRGVTGIHCPECGTIRPAPL